MMTRALFYISRIYCAKTFKKLMRRPLRIINEFRNIRNKVLKFKRFAFFLFSLRKYSHYRYRIARIDRINYFVRSVPFMDH